MAVKECAIVLCTSEIIVEKLIYYIHTEIHKRTELKDKHIFIFFQRNLAVRELHSNDFLVKCFKPRPNELASRRQFKTWVYLRLRLARACVHLRWLAMTCTHFGRDQICTQVKASFSPFGHLTQVNARWVASIDGLLANEVQDMSALKWFFCDSSVLVRKLAGPFGHPTQVSTQVQLASTCDYLPVRLAKALKCQKASSQIGKNWQILQS